MTMRWCPVRPASRRRRRVSSQVCLWVCFYSNGAGRWSHAQTGRAICRGPIHEVCPRALGASHRWSGSDTATCGAGKPSCITSMHSSKPAQAIGLPACQQHRLVQPLPKISIRVVASFQTTLPPTPPRPLQKHPPPTMAVFFDPRPLTNLDPIDSLESLAPILDLKVSAAPGGDGGDVREELRTTGCTDHGLATLGVTLHATLGHPVFVPDAHRDVMRLASPIPLHSSNDPCHRPNTILPFSPSRSSAGQPGERGDPAAVRRLRARMPQQPAGPAPRPGHCRDGRVPPAWQSHSR